MFHTTKQIPAEGSLLAAADSRVFKPLDKERAEWKSLSVAASTLWNVLWRFTHVTHFLNYKSEDSNFDFFYQYFLIMYRITIIYYTYQTLSYLYIYIY